MTKGLTEKTYAALVSPAPPKDADEITFPLKKIAARMRPAPDGQNARTLWSVVKRQEKTALLELSPKTGRTHQLRAHLAAAGWPILGDTFYEGAPAPRLMLHATTLALPSGEIIRSTLPVEFSLERTERSGILDFKFRANPEKTESQIPSLTT